MRETQITLHGLDCSPAETAFRWICLLTVSCLFCFSEPSRADELVSGFANPPRVARLRAYWWWLNGNVTKAAITRDLEEMAAKGFGGALICDAGGADQRGNAQVPHGPTFFSPEWRELYKHTLREADRLGLEMSLNIQSGWNLGGPMVTADDAAKKMTWSETVLSGGTNISLQLSSPPKRDNYFRDSFTLAFRLPEVAVTNRRPIQNLPEKAVIRALHFSAPDTTPLLVDFPAQPGEEDTHTPDVLDLTSKLDADGKLNWNAPPGRWQIIRFGSTISDNSYVSTSSEGWRGFALDVFDAGAFQRYWDAVVEPLISDAGPLAGKTLKYLHTDSWEVEAVNWTPTLRAEFQKRRGYDLLPWLPVIAGHIVNSREESDRFLNDFRRTLGDLAIDNHYKIFKANAHKHGLEIHPESGGPHAVPVDAQQCLGWSDVPMSEFWAWSWTHRIGDTNRFFVKQPASAAHTYGHKIVAAEGFTTIGPHWQEKIWDNLKPSFDRAACEGLNRLVWHAFVCSPEEMGMPGQQYFAGTHFNPNTTWWPVSGPFLAYINRSQFLLQQGLFVADACYYYGDHVPNFSQLKRSDPARVLPGYDYDVVTEEVLLTRMSVRKGRIVLPDGMSYRVLVLPERPPSLRFGATGTAISLPVLRKLKELVRAGATIIGPKPATAMSLKDFPRCDKEVASLAAELWGDGANGIHKFGKGRVVTGKTARETLTADNIQPDFECLSPGVVALDYIHRRADGAEIYFISNPSNAWQNVSCAFRVTGKSPEIWLPTTGEILPGAIFSQHEGHTIVPLRLEPFGSVFIVFRKPARTQITSAEKDGQPVFAAASALDFDGAVGLEESGGKLRLRAAESGIYSVKKVKNRVGTATIGALPAPQMLTNGWTLHARPKELNRSQTHPITLDTLKSWTEFSEPEVKFFSGTLEYSCDIPITADQLGNNRQIWIDLGDVREVAELELNGQKLGILWKPPFRADASRAAKPGLNHLVVRVTNFWPNRIIGDQALPASERVTRTNVRQLTKDTPLMPSGLLGPVRLMNTAEAAVRF